MRFRRQKDEEEHGNLIAKQQGDHSPFYSTTAASGLRRIATRRPKLKQLLLSGLSTPPFRLGSISRHSLLAESNNRGAACVR
jgi:hypothetical protein